MPKPNLEMIADWLDSTFITLLDERRRQAKEWRRHRKLGTLETLWLMLAVSLDTHRLNLYEILRLTTGKLHIRWTISVAAFCKARSHFSPGLPDLAVRHAGEAIADSLRSRAQPLAWPAPAGCRQNHPGPAGV